MVFDAAGRLVRTLLDGRALDAGRHESAWNGDDDRGKRVAPGVYAVSLETPQGRVSRKLHLLR
jgi:flagellar hook assembly protein FlgD